MDERPCAEERYRPESHGSCACSTVHKKIENMNPRRTSLSSSTGFNLISRNIVSKTNVPEIVIAALLQREGIDKGSMATATPNNQMEKYPEILHPKNTSRSSRSRPVFTRTRGEFDAIQIVTSSGKAM